MESAKYFAFTRVNPKPSDYALLVNTCNRIGAYLCYRTVRDDRIRLCGFIVIWGVDEGALPSMFPNFNLTLIQGKFHDNLLRVVKLKGEFRIISVTDLLFGRATVDDLCLGFGSLGIASSESTEASV